MDKAIKKFLAYLDKLEEGINKDFISLHFSKRMDKEVKLKELDLKSREVKNFRKYLTELKDYQENHGEIFADYEILCQYLDSSFLNNREKYEIIMFFIKKNIHSGILISDTLLVDLKDLEDKGVDERHASFIRNLILNNELNSFMVRDVQDLTEGELEIYNIIKMFAVDLSPYKNSTLLFKNHLVDKMDSYDEYDIDVVETTLIDVGVSEDCLKAFIYILNRDLDKRSVEDKVITPVVYQVKRDPNVLTDKEYKAIRKEIKATYDAYNRKLLRDVTNEEMIDIARKMVRIEMDERDIINFFKEVMDANFQYDLGAIGHFVSNYDKYAYYLEEDTLKDVLEYMSEMMICDEETYIFWRNEVGRILRYEANKFNNEYDYELSLVRKSK